MAKSARDLKIAQLYKTGKTQEELAVMFSVTQQRINQILRSQGVSFHDSPHAPRGDRYAFIGANVTHDLKRRVNNYAKRNKKSLSLVVEESLEKTVAKEK